MEFAEKTLTNKEIYRGKVVNLYVAEVLLPNGHTGMREIIKHPGGVVIIAMKDENTILMVKQYRYAIQQVALELPAGKLEYGENPDLAAKRELEEETGYLAKSWSYLGYIYTTPGFCDEKLHFYLAKDLTYYIESPEDDEIIEHFEYNLEDIFELIRTGKLNDSKTICGLARAFKL